MSRPFHNKKRRGLRSNHYIRRCSGFGKFEGGDYTSVFAYDMGMDSGDVCSNDCWGHSANLIQGPFSAWELLQWRNYEGLSLNRAERRFIKRQAGCIVHESGDGFIDVRWYEDRNKLESVWESVQQSYYPDEDSEDDVDL